MRGDHGRAERQDGHSSRAVAILAGIVAGALIGLLQGTWFTRFNVPSFVVTLAGLLAWQGALLFVLGPTGTINLTDPTIVGLANTFVPDAVGWALGIIAIVLYLGAQLFERRRRDAAGLGDGPVAGFAVQVAVLAVVMLRRGRRAERRPRRARPAC